MRESLGIALLPAALPMGNGTVEAADGEVAAPAGRARKAAEPKLD